jgi:CRP-like cAMP-binding protein
MDPILARAAIFYGLGPDVVAELTCRLETVEVGAGAVFFTEGEPGAWSYIIVSGKVKTGCRAADGRENLFAILGPSDMFGELSTFDPGPRTFTATAVTPVRAMLLQRDVLMGWIGEHREVAERMMRILARRLRRTDHDLSDLVFTDVGGRVAKQLLRLAQQFGVQDGDFTRVVHDLTQEELAQLVGAKRETVNKALGEFSARGWITLDGRKSLVISDSQRLASRARDAVLVADSSAADVVRRAAVVIADRFGIDEPQALALLTRMSRDGNEPLGDIAAKVVDREPTASSG